VADFVFKRYELKYLLTELQYRTVRAEVEKRLAPDRFGSTTIQSLYYDTPDFRLVRESIEKPVYKEKLRLRCYGLNDCDKDVFLEMKRKYDGVVYKRRIACKETSVPELFAGKSDPSQIGRELDYFISFYRQLDPKVMILYERSAFFDEAGDLRVTFDSGIRYRAADLSFGAPLKGDTLLPPGTVLMELKSGTGFPLWLAHLLGQERIIKSSFSKYGEAYRRIFANGNDIEKRTEGNVQCLNPFLQTAQLRRQVSSLS